MDTLYSTFLAVTNTPSNLSRFRIILKNYFFYTQWAPLNVKNRPIARPVPTQNNVKGKVVPVL
jgi:hypothetical protein